MINEDILAIIPARGGSKGILRKNIKILNGKPLIAYTIEEALKSKYIKRVIVSTEDEEIASISKAYGSEVPFLRPKELANDDTATIDCILHMLDSLREKERYIPKYVCLLQCTSPLRTVEDIDGTIEKLLKTGIDGSVSVCEAEVNPYWTNIFDGDKLKYFIEEGRQIVRRQDLPKIYRVNGAVYVIKMNVLMHKKTFETENITGYVMNNEKSLDIDNEIDFKFAELLMKECENHA
ncbi:acylneuraminate cytidylyltransferase family protein [Clostridium bowmanii]|uniref:acylneuraminate cytidylyltransferase family protein n=1 Tax=Clostridium bowmanii TaxID=132925 RepID=UPI001C0E4EED|nr:acylneuraminate cytidylyltransferase family protein [Clostridium bowmanii]MBU3190620.1 acylneuraminate cytidylyltransferase family protein [Clostridium bowmanii]MCA1075153.1 acylneuraminate cytidylyltransferase family protein [Clostridium bowmanii]